MLVCAGVLCRGPLSLCFFVAGGRYVDGRSVGGLAPSAPPLLTVPEGE